MKTTTIKKKASATKVVVKKVLRGFRIMVRSRHPSHRPLRTTLSRLPFRTVVRLGSTWAGDQAARIECNSAQSVRTSASKYLMKQAFDAANVITPVWVNGNVTAQRLNEFIQQHGFPIVAKHHYGSRGTGNYLLKTQAELTAWMVGKTLENYIFEKFYDYTREYRLHVTRTGCFYTCRKMLKQGTPENQRWYRNDSNSAWMVEDNPLFDKPSNWNVIVAESVKALTAVGLDIGAIDVKVQSRTNSQGQVRTNPKFIILETNSAPSMKEIGLQKYQEAIPQILRSKAQ